MACFQPRAVFYSRTIYLCTKNPTNGTDHPAAPRQRESRPSPAVGTINVFLAFNKRSHFSQLMGRQVQAPPELVVSIARTQRAMSEQADLRRYRVAFKAAPDDRPAPYCRPQRANCRCRPRQVNHQIRKISPRSDTSAIHRPLAADGALMPAKSVHLTLSLEQLRSKSNHLSSVPCVFLSCDDRVAQRERRQGGGTSG